MINARFFKSPGLRITGFRRCCHRGLRLRARISFQCAGWCEGRPAGSDCCGMESSGSRSPGDSWRSCRCRSVGRRGSGGIGWCRRHGQFIFRVRTISEFGTDTIVKSIASWTIFLSKSPRGSRTVAFTCPGISQILNMFRVG